MNHHDGQQPILITGCARSGTSMTAGIIQICGAFGGRTSPPTKHNRKGMFENVDIRNGIVKPFLKSIDSDPMGQNPLPDIDMVKKVANDDVVVSSIQARFIKVFKSHGYKADRPLYYKGAKLCLIWPLWEKAFPNATWIIVRRDVEDIVRSCLRTSFMRAYTDKSGWIIWAGEHEKRFEEMVDAKLKIYEIWPQRMINGDFKEIQNVINAIGLNWDKKIENKVMEFVEPKLWGKGQGRHGKASS